MRLFTQSKAAVPAALQNLAEVRGSVLVGLLWCLAIVSVIVVGALHSTRMGLVSTKNYADKVQAHYIALAGVETAKALLFHDGLDRKKSARNHTGNLYNSPENFREISFGAGKFSVIRQSTPEEGGKIVFGVSDEESRLNINVAGADQLRKLGDMPAETASAIIDWRDRDNAGQPGGAEKDYYASLKPPYVPRNADIQTLREMLLIRGVTPALLLGEDLNENGVLDPEEDDDDETMPPDNHNHTLEAGWSGLFTLNSLTANKNAREESRVNVQSAGETDLSKIPGISTDLAKAIVAYRDQNRFENIADLMNVAAIQQRPQQNAQPQGNPRQPSRQGGGGGGGGGQTVGPPLISQDLFEEIADDVTIDEASSQKGLININTASVAVLICLNGITEELAQNIVNHRSSSGFFSNIAGLLKVPGITRDIFRQVAPRITARSETFRVLSEGRVTATGARERIEVIIRMSGSFVDTLYYRENL